MNAKSATAPERTVTSVMIADVATAISWMRNPFKFRAAEQTTEVNFYRASGECICDKCGKEYWRHPRDKENLDFHGEPFLKILCNGDRVKL